MTQRTANLGSGCRGAHPPRHRQPVRGCDFRQARLRRLSQVPGRLRLPSGCRRRDTVSASRSSSGDNPRQRAAAPGRAAIVRVPLLVRSFANSAGGSACRHAIPSPHPEAGQLHGHAGGDSAEPVAAPEHAAASPGAAGFSAAGHPAESPPRTMPVSGTVTAAKPTVRGVIACPNIERVKLGSLGYE